MKLKSYFLLLTLLILLSWGIIFYITIEQRGFWFYLTEGLFLCTMLLLGLLYHKVVKPLRSIANGMDLLREQDFSSRLTPVKQIEADRIVQIFNRMMDQLKEERLRLREQNHFLDLLVSASPMGVIILTFEGKISLINSAAVRFLGLLSADEAQNHALNELNSILAQEIESIPKETTKTIRLSDAMIYRCSKLSFIDRGFAHPFILIESLTSEVIKAEKIAYEKVIRMIAHEVNNTVAGITSTLDTIDGAMQSMDDTDELREVMRICNERCFSMSQFITNFANVVKIPEPQLRQVDLNERVINCKMFMENICRTRNITLHLDLCHNHPQVAIDTTLFEQVLVNIIKNAAESIDSDGDIYIQTTYAPPMLQISDTGKGISKEVETKLFSPFFSTKPNGQGIGLLFVREVLTSHSCNFSLRTEQDGLTRFRIRF